MNGCAFAGVTWGAAWWFISRRPAGPALRSYNSGWVILALTIGIGVAGNRGWMQWPSFFEGRLQTNAAAGQSVSIPKAYGFLWLFIAGVPWAGLGACALAWCNSYRQPSRFQWVLRVVCGVVGAALARMAFENWPDIFLPLYSSLKSQYADLQSNPNLRRLINDNRAAITHLGLYLGLLGFEAGWRNWRNAGLIATVGLLNGLGWALCQNWRWAASLWPNANFNFWRCWESSGGISIGIAYGIAFYLFNRTSTAQPVQTSRCAWPNLERFAVHAGLIFGLGLSVKNGLKGWANLYLGSEEHWNRILWSFIGPVMLLALSVLAVWIRRTAVSVRFHGDLFPKSSWVIWAVLVIQNIVAQLVTGPHRSWNETVFSLYYLLLFALSGVIIHHFGCLLHGSFAAQDDSARLEPQPTPAQR